ncbi:ABC-type multidrug transport system, ATPase component [Euzebya pacifica]|uniref:ABC-type multidrug transport system, ATPase component n=1 Tax=Euzebya pacifica TaxID=1608957 RepID=A0A346XZL8_9ACTN|nr:ATP-binding cassette domain-containing protein [Euzebya pacifica]AXV07665.1 ABC-type multidrug transport system, ATPase component [Euzebya pacifica]
MASAPTDGPLLVLRGVTVDIAGQPAVRDIDLTVPPGSIVALVGGDGAGKTTLLRTLAGRLRPNDGRISRAEGLTAGVMPATGAVFEDLTVAEHIAFARRAHHLRADTGHELLVRMGLGDAVHRLAGRLSGGMRQKLALAVALQHQPDLLLLDEPTTGVDPISRAEIWRLLTEEVAAGRTVVMATTYLDEAARASTVVVMHDGDVLDRGTAAEIRQRMPGELTTGPQPLPGVRSWRRGAAWRRWHPDGVPPIAARERIDPDLEDAVVVATLRRATADELEPGPTTPRFRRPARPSGPRTPAVAADDASIRFGPVSAVQAVSLHVDPGEVVGLLGANGAGKTTLIRALLGLQRLTDGRAELLGGPPGPATRARVGYVPQGLGLYQDLTVAANRRFQQAAYGVHADPPTTVAGIDEGTLVGALPLGLQRRLAFAVATAHRPDLLILDEPTSGVGPLGRARLWEDIHDAATAGTAVLVTTHHLAEAEQCQRLVVMAAGVVVASGTVEAVIGGQEAVTVPTSDPGPVVDALVRAHIAATLADGGVATADADADRVREVLRAAGLPDIVTTRPATLEERFVTLGAERDVREPRMVST